MASDENSTGRKGERDESRAQGGVGGRKRDVSDRKVMNKVQGETRNAHDEQTVQKWHVRLKYTALITSGTDRGTAWSRSAR